VGGAWLWAMLLAAAASMLSVASAAPGPSEARALSRTIAESYQAEERGILAFDVTQHSTIRGGPFRRDDYDVTAFVQTDGRLTAKAVLRHVEGSRSEDHAALAKREAEPESPLGRYGMRLPCDPSALDDYSFDAPVVQQQEVVLPFRTRVHDPAHGDGRIVFDSAAARIVRIDFTPSVPPDRASSANVVITFGPLMPDRRGIVKIVRVFEGHVGLVRGRVDSTSLYGNARAFSSATAAIEAIEHER